jgi:sugar phosphate isomerase/epimerase
MNRRDFLRNTALTTATVAVAGPAFSKMTFGTQAMRPIGLQLFTLFGALEQDVAGNLKKIADLGYSELESAFSMKPGFYGMGAKEFAKLTKSLGLAWRSHHVLGTPFVLPPGAKVPAGLENMPKPKDLKNNAQELVDEAAEGGVSYLVCSSIDISTGDNVKSSIDILAKAGDIASKAGLGFAYHNHDKEFKEVDGIVPYDQFLSQLSSNVKMELDLAWAAKAGKDPVELFKKNPGRYPLWHVKDFDKDFKTLQPVGKGVIDFKKIFAAADTAGLQHAFVEHDMPPNAFESIAASITYLKTILK